MFIKFLSMISGVLMGIGIVMLAQGIVVGITPITPTFIVD